MAQRTTEIKVGIFVLIALLLAGGMIIRFGKYTRLAQNTYEITVVFPNVAGIVKDANVLYGGITVGKVRGISLDQTGILKVNVKLAIYEGVKIRSDSKFVVNQSGLLGDRYIDVIPQGATAAPLKPGDVVEGTTSVDLSEAIRSVVDVLRQAAGTIERVDKIIRRIDESVLSSQSLSHVSSVFANFDATTSNTTALTQSLRDIVEENRQNVSNAVAKVSSAAGTLQNASRRVDDLVVTNQDDIRIAIQNLTESSERLNTMMTRLEQGEGTLGKLIVDPSLHDEVLRLVRNLRRYGLLYKEGAAAKAVDQQRGKTPAAGRPAQKGTGTLNFGTDSTTPTDGK